MTRPAAGQRVTLTSVPMTDAGVGVGACVCPCACACACARVCANAASDNQRGKRTYSSAGLASLRDQMMASLRSAPTTRWL